MKHGWIRQKARNNMTEKDLAEDYRMVLHEAKSMGCNEIKALYNIPLKNMEMIVQALEKQIPKKVVKDGKWSYKCPCCGECAETDCGDAFYDYRLDYCNGCGQKLDWSDEE